MKISDEYVEGDYSAGGDQDGEKVFEGLEAQLLVYYRWSLSVRGGVGGWRRCHVGR